MEGFIADFFPAIPSVKTVVQNEKQTPAQLKEKIAEKNTTELSTSSFCLNSWLKMECNPPKTKHSPYFQQAKCFLFIFLQLYCIRIMRHFSSSRE